MTRTTVRAPRGGVGFIGLLTIAFIVLKLTHVIDWSWWLILAPLWIGALIWLALCALLVVVVLLGDGVRRR